MTFKMKKAIRTNFCYVVKPAQKSRTEDIEAWLETNYGTRALHVECGIAYWTRGCWELSIRDIEHLPSPAHCDAEDEDDLMRTSTWDVFDYEWEDSREQELHALFISDKDAIAFKMAFG